uniref:Uncharacterized protein n=1 Tax=Amazona collaria TaxID=241587 RepID=A0A8B9G7U4_9PSIT
VGKGWKLGGTGNTYALCLDTTVLQPHAAILLLQDLEIPVWCSMQHVRLDISKDEALFPYKTQHRNSGPCPVYLREGWHTERPQVSKYRDFCVF